jgi:hypothetical protein
VKIITVIDPRKHMPNVGTVLKEEIVRLSRKESRHQVDPTKRRRRSCATTLLR